MGMAVGTVTMSVRIIAIFKPTTLATMPKTSTTGWQTNITQYLTEQHKIITKNN